MLVIVPIGEEAREAGRKAGQIEQSVVLANKWKEKRAGARTQTHTH